MLPHVRDRPLTLFRWPEGIARRRVLEKHWLMQLPAFVDRVSVFSESKRTADQYILCNNLATLLWLAQMGVLELHAWHSRVRPGRDAPDAGRDFASSAGTLQRSLLERPDYVPASRVRRQRTEADGRRAHAPGDPAQRDRRSARHARARPPTSCSSGSPTRMSRCGCGGGSSRPTTTSCSRDSTACWGACATRCSPRNSRALRRRCRRRRRTARERRIQEAFDDRAIDCALVTTNR